MREIEKVSTMVIEVFGGHAMFRNDNKNGAIKSNIQITNDEEDDDDDGDDGYQLPITIAAISKAKPPIFSEWLDWCEIKKKLKKMLESSVI